MVREANAQSPGGPQSLGLEILVDAIDELSSARSVEDIAGVVRTAARRLSGADGITLVLREGELCHYVDEDAIGPLWKGRKFPIRACVSGFAMLHRTTVVIPDIYKDDRVPHDTYRRTFVKSMVMTPVGGERPFAAIGAYWAEARTPSEEEVTVLKAIARTTATAFQNVRLLGSLEKEIEQREFLIRELDHRAKNMLASVQAIAVQTLKGAQDQREFVAVFNSRLQALSRAHELLARGGWKQAGLEELAQLALAPFGGADAGRLKIQGPHVGLRPETAVAMLLGLHELGANAARHGALSAPGGKVSLTWDVDLAEEPRKLRLEWRETGGPKVDAAPCRGVGSRLIEVGMAHALGGAAKLEFPPEGVRFSLNTPLSDRVALA